MDTAALKARAALDVSIEVLAQRDKLMASSRHWNPRHGTTVLTR
jgi:hypothetical protein